MLARCSKTPDPSAPNKDGSLTDIKNGLIDSEMEISLVLKGTTNQGRIIVRSQYWPRQGENYLIFSHFFAGVYQGFETYRVVPLGLYFPTNILTGKPLDEQVKIALQYRLDMLNREMQKEQEEKQRLEQGLKK